MYHRGQNTLCLQHDKIIGKREKRININASVALGGKMEERDDLLLEIRKQNRYLKRQLMCSRIVVMFMLLIAIAAGGLVYVGYPKVQNAMKSVKDLSEKAEQTMTDIQTMSRHADKVVLQAGEMLNNLEPQVNQLEQIDMESFVENLNGLVENLNGLNEDIKALNLDKLGKTIEALQKAVEPILDLPTE